MNLCALIAHHMLGQKSGFETLVHKKTPYVVTHCFIHQEALASKTSTDGLKCACDLAIKIVNYIKSSALNSRVFKKLCENLNSYHKYILYHTKVRWLSRSNVVAKVFELRNELKIFLEAAKPGQAVHFQNSKLVFRLAYLMDIFEALNQLNLKMQGKENISFRL